MPLNPSILKDIGQALFGDAWRDTLAEILEVTPETVEDWAAGWTPLPPELETQLAIICQFKSNELARIALALDPEV